MRQHAPAVPGHQHDTGLWPRPCCELWPPAGRVRTIGNILTTGRLTHGVIYAARLLATLGAVAAVHALLLPATTQWAGAHGRTGWTIWMLWAMASLAAVFHGVIARRRSITAVYALHALAITGALMAVAAPGGWAQALTGTGGATVAWLVAMHATHRWHRRPPL
jgi:hypothetical protein